LTEQFREAPARRAFPGTPMTRGKRSANIFPLKKAVSRIRERNPPQKISLPWKRGLYSLSGGPGGPGKESDAK